MRLFFIILLLLHALIHLLGFVKAYRPEAMEGFQQLISKPLGTVWLLTSLLFLVVLISFISRSAWWLILAFLAIVLSQILIIIFWQDAKLGTFLNLIILAVAVSTYGKMRFQKMASKEATEILSPMLANHPLKSEKNELNSLPPIVQKWIIQSGIEKVPEIISVRLKQAGEMRTKPEGKWMSFSAEQYFDVKDPAFIWITEVNMLPLVRLNGRDKLKDAKGEMLIKALSLFKVVDTGRNEQINSGSMLRFLGEICWFPSAAQNFYLRWEPVGESAARAYLTSHGREVSGIFRFNEKGEMLSFETLRYMGDGQEAKQQLWLIEVLNHKTFNGVKIPSKCRVTWKLPEGDFTWLNLEISDLDYNIHQIYED